MTIQELIRRKQELGLSNRVISEKTGLPVSTVQKIFSGATASPRPETLQVLEKLLRPRVTYMDTAPETSDAICGRSLPTERRESPASIRSKIILRFRMTCAWS